MSMNRILRLGTLCTFLITLGTSGVFGQDSQSGTVTGFQDGVSATRTLPPGMDDLLQSSAGLDEPGAELNGVREADSMEASVSDYPLWKQLAAFDATQRSNAVIQLELGRGVSEDDLATAATIESFWNGGQYAQAIAALQAFEESDGRLGIGIDWQVPQPIFSRGLDVRLGGTRTEAQTLCLDFDEQSGNLFSIIRWGSTTGTAVWTMNISTDDGATWSETYSWSSGVGIIDVAAAVVDDYVYVGYVAGDTFANDGRMRRCLASTGAVDSGYGFYSIIDAGYQHDRRRGDRDERR